MLNESEVDPWSLYIDESVEDIGPFRCFCFFVLRSLALFWSSSSGLGPLDGWMASGGIPPIGACNFEWGSASFRQMPAFWKASLRCWFKAWAEGSLVASQPASFWALLVSHAPFLPRVFGL